MRKKLAWFAQNADTVMPLLLGTAVSILALAGAASQEVVDGSMLACLAVLAFALIRDRLSDEAAARRAQQQAVDVAEALKSFGEALRPAAELPSVVSRLQDTVENLSTIKTLRGQDIVRTLAEARRHTDRWHFKGGTGTYTRAVTLPDCVAHARRDRRPLTVRLEIIDPTDRRLCERYYRYRTSLSSGPDGTGEPWTLDRTRKESYATVVAAYYWQQRYNLLDITVGLASTMSTYRFDLSSSRLVVTQDDQQFPAVVIGAASPLYDAYATELNTSLAQARTVRLDQAATVLDDVPTGAQVRAFLDEVGVPLPVEYSEDDVSDVIERAVHAKNPY